MADNRKTTILRPKVRFSQSAESPPSSDASRRAFSKPRIKSVIDLKGPSVLILKTPTEDFGKKCDFEKSELQQSSGDGPNDLRLCPRKSTGQSAPCLTEIILTPENRVLKTKNVVDTTKTKTVAAAVKSQPYLKKNNGTITKKVLARENFVRRDSSASGRKCCGSLPVESKQGREIQTSSRSVSQGGLSSTQVGKENLDIIRESKKKVLKVPENTPRTRRSDAEDDKSPTSFRRETAQTCINKREDFNARKASKLRIDAHRKSVKEIGLMPCMKAPKGRRKSSPAKKTIIRDVSSGRSNAYVGPGLPRPRSLEPEISLKSKVPRSRSEILSGDKLARPEYNSIVGTIKKLQHLREEKINKNLEHLPAIYRGLVNGKVSTSALDFGANEAIYRDLVDLSIDEKQLPSRLTRSKDPEPRQKDLVPKLSDFFVPRNDEEYRKAVFPSLPTPRVLDIWNPYKISDRIFAWKENLDHDL